MKKLKIMLTGYNGRMGRVITEVTSASDDCIVVVGIDINPAPINPSFPVFIKPSDFKDKVDVIIDFSHHSAIDSLIEYAVSSMTPIVIATTGHDENEKEIIKKASQKIPIFMSANMSLGVNLVCSLAKKAAEILGRQYNIEIIEKHHNQKLDAPSGTALMIADSMASVMDKPEYVYDRHSYRKKRTDNEIGIHSIRGGTIVGEHDVLFAGVNEVISISHSALSREMFAGGAIVSAKYIVDQKAGIYSMSNLLETV